MIQLCVVIFVLNLLIICLMIKLIDDKNDKSYVHGMIFKKMIYLLKI